MGICRGAVYGWYREGSIVVVVAKGVVWKQSQAMRGTAVCGVGEVEGREWFNCM
jgi:hypothetical protein